MKVAFIGLGIMGLPMAKNLLAAGHDVAGYNRSAPAVRALAEAGGRAADSIADAVDGAEAVITMLPDSPDVETVYAAEGGVFAAASPGALLVDMSTIRPDVAAGLAATAEGLGLTMVDAPVSGGQRGAEDAVLSIMCGGTPEGFDRARPLLEALGTTIARVGGPGAGQTVKAANQLLVAGIIELVAEAMVFLDAYGVDLATATALLNGGLAGNTVLTRKGEGMIAGDFTPGFRVELHHKDLGIYRDAARAKGVFSPLGAQLGELMASLRATGGGSLDHGALLAQVSELSANPRWGRGA